MKVDINKLLESMTLSEKIGQLTQVSPDLILNHENNNEDRKTVNLQDDKIFEVGSLTGLGDGQTTIDLQNIIIEKSRLKIPLLSMMDVIHGFTTNYQIALGLGCAFNPEQVRELSRISGYEASLNGVNVSYTPMADLTNDPRWGRFMEIPSEDTKVCEDYTAAIVEGFQNNLDASAGDMAACVKHFAGYGLAEGGRDYGAASASKQMMYEKYYRAYRSGINAGTKMVMTAFNTLDGVACTGNYELLRTVLREEFGFDGVIISDHSSIQELVDHGQAKDRREAAKIAIMCGVDIELATTCYSEFLQDLVDSGEVDIKYIDQSVLRVLKLKADLGLFDNPYGATNPKLAEKFAYGEQLSKVYKQASIDSFVLLKNDQALLPLSDSQKVSIVGTHFDNKDTIGFNACVGTTDGVITIKEYAESQKLDHYGYQIADLEKLTDEDIKNSVEIFKKTDIAILPLGEASRWSGEGVSRANIELPASQIQLVNLARQHSKKVIAVVFAGRPLDLSAINTQVDSILYVWFPGHHTGDAIIDVLYGTENVSGKLSCSLPRNVGQIPTYYNCLPTGREKKFLEQEYVNGYRDLPNEPLYPFGFGLSYSKFEYSKIRQVSKTQFEVDVKNISAIDGTEIVQMYIHDLVADVSRPVKELKGYQKVYLKAQEEITVQFEVEIDDLKYYNNQLEYKMDDGQFKIMIGPDSQNYQEVEVEFKKENYGH